jgi:hypothetical protein
VSPDCIVGVSDHGGWAVLVTASRNGTLLDRRRVELVDERLPKLPHHHDAQGLAEDQAVAMVDAVRASAEKHAALALEAVAQAVPDVRGIALRVCPPLPPTIFERITDYRSQNVADWVMYRQAMAAAAEARGWGVYWFDAKKEEDQAAAVVGDLASMRSRFGPPWDKDHRVAMAASIVSG